MRKRKLLFKLDSPQNKAIEYGMLLLGCSIIAASFNLFLNPNQVASGGVAGISTIIQHMYGIRPAVVQWMLNIPLFVAGVMFLGGKFGLKTAIGSIVLPLFVLLSSGLKPLTNNLLLATIYGGIGVGLGLGIVFRARGSTGGLDTAAQLLLKFTGISYGLAIAMIDGLVILTAGIVFSPEKALYALMGLFVTTKMIDVVQLGFQYAKVAFIISDEPDALSQAILYELDRGLTKLDAHGGYTGQTRPVFMVVVNQREVSRLKTIVKSVDPAAFIILSDTAEVLGEGFKNNH